MTTASMATVPIRQAIHPYRISLDSEIPMGCIFVVASKCYLNEARALLFQFERCVCVVKFYPRARDINDPHHLCIYISLTIL
jgi:hypothetical protein